MRPFIYLESAINLLKKYVSDQKVRTPLIKFRASLKQNQLEGKKAGPQKNIQEGTPAIKFDTSVKEVQVVGKSVERKRVPLIAFRAAAKPGGLPLPAATQKAPTPVIAKPPPSVAKAPPVKKPKKYAAFRFQLIEDSKLPKKYARKRPSPEEIAAVNDGGADSIIKYTK